VERPGEGIIEVVDAEGDSVLVSTRMSRAVGPEILEVQVAAEDASVGGASGQARNLPQDAVEERRRSAEKPERGGLDQLSLVRQELGRISHSRFVHAALPGGEFGRT
jgi:hypothetical protein